MGMGLRTDGEAKGRVWPNFWDLFALFFVCARAPVSP